ncbi:MAG: ABC transporter permease [Planctomycetes bacterium]|nr:ABC transporter permease [Planctomycetota bacterium]
MRKTIVVAVREYKAAVKTKAFVVTLVAMPILMGGSIAVQVFLRDKVDTTDRTLAVVDLTGVLFDDVAKAALLRNREDIFAKRSEDRKQVRPRFVLEEHVPSSKDLDEVRLELSERVRAKELFAFAIIPSDAIVPAEGGAASKIQYHSNTPTYRALNRWLAQTVNEQIQKRRFDLAGLDRVVIKKAMERTLLDDRMLVTRDESGAITVAEKTNKAANFGVPAGLMMLMLMVVMVGASPLVNSVLEEKMQRIAEVLLGSIPPFQLMLGKLLGTVGVSLTLAAVYLAGGFAALTYAGYGAFFPTHLLWWFVLYQSLAVMMYGSVYIAVGAACSDIKETQAMLMPLMIVIMAPFFLWANVLKAPSATFAVVVSLFPPATPMLMLLRQSIPPGVPAWQPALGIVLVTLTTILFVFVAGRIFRVGILMQGKGAKFGEMIRWTLRG